MAGWPRALAILLAAAVSGPAARAASDHAGLRVDYRDDRLSVHAEEVPLRQVLDAIAAASGAEIRGQPIYDQPVSTDLEAGLQKKANVVLDQLQPPAPDTGS
jgi:hypothetical protein